jgi:hypothetical protein
MQCFSLQTTGDTAVVSIREDVFGFFEDLYDTISAYGVDYVGLNPRLGIWVDDYAAPTKPRNIIATNIAKALGYPGQIYGDVMFSGPFKDSVIQPLADDAVETLQLMARLISKETDGK